MTLCAALCLLAVLPMAMPTAYEHTHVRSLWRAALLGALLGLLFPITAWIALQLEAKRTLGYVPTMEQSAYAPLALGALILVLMVSAATASAVAASGAALGVRVASEILNKHEMPARKRTWLAVSVAAVPVLVLCGPLFVQQIIRSGYQLPMEGAGGCGLFIMHVSLAAAAAAFWTLHRFKTKGRPDPSASTDRTRSGR